MKDIFDRPLAIGDIVACRRSGSKSMVIGEIVSFGKKQVTVSYKYRNIINKVYHYPYDVCKAEGSVVKEKIKALIEKYQGQIEEFKTTKYWTDAEYDRAEARRDILRDEIIPDLGWI